MKKVYCIILAYVLLVTPMAQAKSCILNGCDYITDAQFNSGTTYWDDGGGNGVTYPTAAACTTSKVAHLDNTEWVSQSFYVDDSYVQFSLNFDLYHPNDTDNWYDQLTVTVRNDDTGATETFYYRGSSFSNNCSSPQQNHNLTGNYSNANVTVKFQVAYLALGQFEIDNVGFWGFK